MVGQKELQSLVLELISKNRFPRFTILKGAKGSGKKMFADWISLQYPGTTYTYMLPDVKVDTIREMIANAYKVSGTTFYIIPDADNMSLAAKNAILKVTEEPPNNAYFIMTLEDESKTLDTIKSRASIMSMERYTPTEIVEYAELSKSDRSLIVEEIDVVCNLCDTPGEVDELFRMRIIDFYDYVNSVVDNVATVSGANSFKIADKLNVGKEDSDKYDLKLFWKAFMKICVDRVRETGEAKYVTGITITSRYLQELYITGINKQSTFDIWLLDIRAEWME